MWEAGDSSAAGCNRQYAGHFAGLPLDESLWRQLEVANTATVAISTPDPRSTSSGVVANVHALGEIPIVENRIVERPGAMCVSIALNCVVFAVAVGQLGVVDRWA